jgi:hypothetical protein
MPTDRIGQPWPVGPRRPVLELAGLESTHRILTPCRLATDDELPASARSLIELATEHNRKPIATYALAETIKTGVLVRSVSVRFTAFRAMITPRADYVDGRFDLAWWLGVYGLPRRVGNDELRALVAGQTYVPPVVELDTCSRCDRPGVRMTIKGVPYAHNRPETKDRCVA